MSDSFTWRGLVFTRPEGSDTPLCSGHWSIWRPKTVWTVTWMGAGGYYEAVEATAEEDPTDALERLRERMLTHLTQERAQIDSMKRLLEHREMICEALARDLEALGVPAGE